MNEVSKFFAASVLVIGLGGAEPAQAECSGLSRWFDRDCSEDSVPKGLKPVDPSDLEPEIYIPERFRGKTLCDLYREGGVNIPTPPGYSLEERCPPEPDALS